VLQHDHPALNAFNHVGPSRRILLISVSDRGKKSIQVMAMRKVNRESGNRGYRNGRRSLLTEMHRLPSTVAAPFSPFPFPDSIISSKSAPLFTAEEFALF
jgi:hypothetical protein